MVGREEREGGREFVLCPRMKKRKVGAYGHDNIMWSACTLVRAVNRLLRETTLRHFAERSRL